MSVLLLFLHRNIRKIQIFHIVSLYSSLITHLLSAMYSIILIHTHFSLYFFIGVFRSIVETGKRFPVLFLFHHKNGTMYAGSMMVS